MLLFIDRAEAASPGGSKALHFKRMGWLLLFGWLHYALIWYGDILTLYAGAGMLIWRWRTKDASALYARALIFLSLALILWAGIIGSIIWAVQAASVPGSSGANAVDAKSIADALASIGAPGSVDIAKELILYRSDYATIFAHRAVEESYGPLILWFGYGFETVGLMALGMALFRGGFLTGDWTRQAYLRVIRIGYGIGLTAMGALAFWCVWSGYDTLIVGGSVTAWSSPFRVPIAVAHAAVALLVIQSSLWPRLIARVTAAGQAAFTNYIASSLMMTTIFYGYGLGLFGQVSRFAVYGFVLLAWAAMLFWSKPWMDRYRHGPIEWLWRCLTRCEFVGLRR